MQKIIFTLLVAVLFAACTSSPDGSQTEAPAVPVLATAPVIKDLPVYVETIGTLRAFVTMDVFPQVNGTLQEVLVHEGQWVQKGQPLFKINPQSYQIKVQEQEAQLVMDRAALESAQKKLERFKSLAQKDFLAQTEWDEVETNVAVAVATVDLDLARLKSAMLDLEDCVITSPITGRLSKFDASPGLHVSKEQTDPLVTVATMDPMVIEFSVTEKEFAKFSSEKQDVEIQSLATSDEFKKGKITFLDNHFDSKTGLLLVRAQIENPQYLLRPGQNIRVRVPVDIAINQKLIPQKAVRYNQQGAYVYVVQPDNTVGFRQVHLGEEQGDDVIVLDGIEPSDFVITDGHLRLYPGIKVEIKS